jgi:hypothetical protein
MGQIYSEITLSNPSNSALLPLTINALVDAGAIPLEDMDLVIHPAQLKLTVNPNNPNIAHTLVTANYE